MNVKCAAIDVSLPDFLPYYVPRLVIALLTFTCYVTDNLYGKSSF